MRHERKMIHLNYMYLIMFIIGRPSNSPVMYYILPTLYLHVHCTDIVPTCTLYLHCTYIVPTCTLYLHCTGVHCTYIVPTCTLYLHCVPTCRYIVPTCTCTLYLHYMCPTLFLETTTNDTDPPYIWNIFGW